MSDVVTDGISGRLIASGDVDGLAAAITELLGDPAQRARLGSAARGAVYPRYDVARLVSDMTALYRSLVPVTDGRAAQE